MHCENFATHLDLFTLVFWISNEDRLLLLGLWYVTVLGAKSSSTWIADLVVSDYPRAPGKTFQADIGFYCITLKRKRDPDADN